MGQRRQGSRAGQTLLEVTIAAVLLGALLGAIGMTTQSGSDACRESMDRAIVESHAQRLVDRVATEFLDASRGTLPPNAVSAQLSMDFARPTGYAAGALVTGPGRRVGWVSVAGEPADGLDNDSDGLVDEGSAVLVLDTGALTPEELELATGVTELLEGELANGVDDNANGVVDEPGLSFDWDPARSVMTIRATLGRRGADGVAVLGTAETAVLVRNQ